MCVAPGDCRRHRRGLSLQGLCERIQLPRLLAAGDGHQARRVLGGHSQLRALEVQARARLVREFGDFESDRRRSTPIVGTISQMELWGLRSERPGTAYRPPPLQCQRAQYPATAAGRRNECPARLCRYIAARLKAAAPPGARRSGWGLLWHPHGTTPGRLRDTTRRIELKTSKPGGGTHPHVGHAGQAGLGKAPRAPRRLRVPHQEPVEGAPRRRPEEEVRKGGHTAAPSTARCFGCTWPANRRQQRGTSSMQCAGI